MDMSSSSCTAVIVASGAGTRLGFDKLLWSLEGEPVLSRSIRAVMAAERVSVVVVVCPVERWNKLPPLPAGKPLVRVDGGAERQDSVACGLAAVPAESTLVLVHDGARPLVSPADIDNCIAAAAVHGGAVLAHPVVDTIKRADEEGFCSEAVDRSGLWCMETPQVFRKDWLSEAIAALTPNRISVTDEVSALRHAGYPVKFVASTCPNPKITHSSDLGLASALVIQQQRSPINHPHD